MYFRVLFNKAGNYKVKLIIDFGNTQTKIALFDEDELAEIKTIDEFNPQIVQSFFENHEIDSTIHSSVIDHPSEIIDYIKSKCYFLELDQSTPLPVVNKYETPKTLGMDRLSAAVGANKIFRNKHTLVIDAGSCITYDFINNKNEYLGGSISPGINMRFKALNTFTDRLPKLGMEEVEGIIGCSTEESIILGVKNGVLNEVQGTIDDYKKDYPDLKIVLCGGDSAFFEKNLKSSIFVAPNLVVEGLNDILNFNLYINAE